MGLLVFIYLFIRTYINMADPGRVCRPCDWWETIFTLRYVSWKGEGKKAGVRNEVEKTLGSAVRRAPPALATTETEREGETLSEWFILILFLLFPATRRWRFIDFSFETPSWFSSDITNVTCRVRSSFCVSQRDEKRLTTVHERYHRRYSEVISLWNCDEIESISALLGKCVPREIKIQEFKRVIV